MLGPVSLSVDRPAPGHQIFQAIGRGIAFVLQEGQIVGQPGGPLHRVLQRIATDIGGLFEGRHALLGLDNVVATPHVGFNTPEATVAMVDFGIDNLVQYFAGDPINVIIAPGRAT